jgi:FkbM family methyltransferase
MFIKIKGKDMKFIRSFRKKTINFFFKRLTQSVRNESIRPFCIDKQGLWFKTKYGFSVYSNLKNRILELDVKAAWEDMESGFILDNIKEGDVFIDVGANIGYFSMLAAKKKAAKVLAIEPAPNTFTMLDMNIQHNVLTNVIETFNVALGSKDGKVKFVSSLGPKNHIEYETENIHEGLPAIDVDIITLDGMLRSRKEIEKINFIKVDIEGAEYAFLLGAQKTIEVFKPMILMEIQEHRLVKYNVTARQIFNFMDNLGYKYLLVTESVIKEAGVYKEDLKKGRDFIFYTSCHSPIY